MTASHVRAGKAKYDSKKHALVWKIKKFTGATEHSLVSAVELIATTREKKSWSRPPISMTFQVGPACSLQEDCAACLPIAFSILSGEKLLRPRDVRYQEGKHARTPEHLALSWQTLSRNVHCRASGYFHVATILAWGQRCKGGGWCLCVS